MKGHGWLRIASALALGIALVAAVGWPVWQEDGVALCVAINAQEDPQIIPDDTGGATITWTDKRVYSTTSWDIYAQRVDSNGNTLWISDGVSLCTASYDQRYPEIVSDGSGGAIVAWEANV